MDFGERRPVLKDSLCLDFGNITPVFAQQYLFLLKNLGKSYFCSSFQLNTEVKLDLISHLQLTQPSGILHINLESVFVWILETEDFSLLKIMVVFTFLAVSI